MSWRAKAGHPRPISAYILWREQPRNDPLIEQAGWLHVATRGSHWQFTHRDRPGRVTVPHPQRDIPLGTLRNIERQASINLRKH